jgi:surface antigen
LACAIIIGINSNKASALPLEDVQKSNSPSSSSELIVFADKNDLVEDHVELAAISLLPTEEVQVVDQKHVVVESETLSKIAESYQTTWKRIYDKNKAITDPNIVNPGDVVIIPKQEEVLEERDLPVIIQTNKPLAKSTNNTTNNTQTKTIESSQKAERGSVAGNGYVAGYCTWYVKNRRPDMPNNLGNASTWVARASAQGMATGSAPQVGAVGQKGNHVVYVESVNGDGTVTISEMNHKGRYVMTTRTVPASYFKYIY